MNEHARRELEPPASILKRGSIGRDVTRLQAWLCLHGFHTAIDGEFGPATEAALRAYQQTIEVGSHATPLPVAGTVDATTWEALTAPLRHVLGWERMPFATGGEIVSCAVAHLAANPREVGKPNGGPFARYYCRGQEVPWCAGFVGTVLEQALGHDEWYTLSCDELAAKAHARGLLTVQPPKEWQTAEHVKPGDLFLIRRTERWPHDWIHTGIVTAVGDGYFETIEGNTYLPTPGGAVDAVRDRNGDSVQGRVRAFNNRTDFVLVGEAA